VSRAFDELNCIVDGAQGRDTLASMKPAGQVRTMSAQSLPHDLLARHGDTQEVHQSLRPLGTKFSALSEELSLITQSFAETVKGYQYDIEYV
jgi:hypothetical protein